MKAIEVLIEVPCFKCLYAEPIKESHLHCNPNDCEKLTQWIFLQVEMDNKKKETVKLEVAHTEESPSQRRSNIQTNE